MKENEVLKLSFEFAIDVVNLYKILITDKKEFVLSKQLLRSGTSVGANIREAQNAESKMDFVHKLGIAQKEIDETIYWLELLKATDYIDKDKFSKYIQKAESIIKLIKRIIISTKSNINKSKINNQ